MNLKFFFLMLKAEGFEVSKAQKYKFMKLGQKIFQTYSVFKNIQKIHG